MRNPKKVESQDALKLFSLKHLSLQIGISKEELIDVSKNIKRHYTIEEKEQLNLDGTLKKKRSIYHPSKRLERILKAIDKHLLKKIRLPDVMHGSRKKHSTITNARIHTGKKYVHNIDIANFFPSIKPNHVYNLFVKRLQCSPSISKLLKELCTADNHVPQGYNTSPNIANLVLMPIAERIESLCKKQLLDVTIYTDDITKSGNKNPEKYLKSIEKIINEYGFKIKSEKTSCKKNHEKQKVTGIIVNKKLNIDGAEFKDLRAKIHICYKYGALTFVGKIINKKGEILDTKDKVRKHLAGRLSYCNKLNPDRFKKIKQKFESIDWAAI